MPDLGIRSAFGVSTVDEPIAPLSAASAWKSTTGTFQ